VLKPGGARVRDELVPVPLLNQKVVFRLLVKKLYLCIKMTSNQQL